MQFILFFFFQQFILCRAFSIWKLLHSVTHCRSHIISCAQQKVICPFPSLGTNVRVRVVCVLAPNMPVGAMPQRPPVLMFPQPLLAQVSVPVFDVSAQRPGTRQSAGDGGRSAFHHTARITCLGEQR